MASRLDGKVALITGAGSGIGLATARRFVSEGAYVFMADRDAARLDAEAASIGSQARPIVADVSKSADLDALYVTIAQEADRLDILVANAGIGTFAALPDITEDFFDTVFGVNVKGVLFTVQKALPLLAHGASVILMSSIQATKGDPAFSVYGASKAAVRQFARGWTSDLKDRRIRVNAVLPGTIETPAVSNLMQSDEALKALYDHVSATVPLGRQGKPDEVAKAVAFLASDDASYITGIELFVDGGAVQV